jgi:acetyl-CoA synthetase
LPGATPCKPGSATFPLPGVRPVLVDEQGNELHGNGVSGNLCLQGSWPGQARTILNDHERFRQTYFTMYPGKYFTGDGCRRDEDGYYWITGRVDDVLNVAGHRLGTAEIESALVAHEFCAEAAVVGFPHDVKGTGIYAYVIAGKPADGVPAEEVEAVLKQQVRKAIGPIATPDRIQVVARACRRRAAARSCAASCARSPKATTPTSATSRRWPSRRWSSRSCRGTRPEAEADGRSGSQGTRRRTHRTAPARAQPAV